jgi:hypothetical protein
MNGKRSCLVTHLTQGQASHDRWWKSGSGCHGAARNGAPLAPPPTPFSGERMRRILRKLLLLAQRRELLGRPAAKLQPTKPETCLTTSAADVSGRVRHPGTQADGNSGTTVRPPLPSRYRSCLCRVALTPNACPPPSCSTAGELAAVINKSSVATASDGPTQFGRGQPDPSAKHAPKCP